MGDNTATIELDCYERGAVLSAMTEKRNRLIGEKRPTDTVDDVIIKVAQAKPGKHRVRDEAR